MQKMDFMNQDLFMIKSSQTGNKRIFFIMGKIMHQISRANITFKGCPLKMLNVRYEKKREKLKTQTIQSK